MTTSVRRVLPTLAVAAMMLGGLAGCGGTTHKVSVAGKVYNVADSDQITSANGEAAIMHAGNLSLSQAQCAAQKLSSQGIKTVAEANTKKNESADADAFTSCQSS